MQSNARGEQRVRTPLGWGSLASATEHGEGQPLLQMVGHPSRWDRVRAPVNLKVANLSHAWVSAQVTGYAALKAEVEQARREWAEEQRQGLLDQARGALMHGVIVTKYDELCFHMHAIKRAIA